MKKILIITTLLLPLILPSTSHAEWKFVTKDTKFPGDDYYINFDRVKRSGNMVYFWMLLNSTWNSNNKFSIISRHSANCIAMEYNELGLTQFNQPMGRGQPKESMQLNKTRWWSPAYNSYMHRVLEAVCK
jgi:hypothetical protein